MFTDNSFIRFDWAAKNILRDKSDFEIFEGFLSVLFKEKVKIVELLESESNKEKEDEFVGVNTGDTLLFNHKGKKQLGKKRRNNIFPEYYIIRVEQFEKETADTPLEEWMLYLKTGYISPDTMTPGLQKARERLRVLSMSDEVRRKYEKYLYNMVYEKDLVETAHDEGEEKGIEIGIELGRAEGEKEKLLEIVGKMKAIGMDEATILQLTGYSDKPS